MSNKSPHRTGPSASMIAGKAVGKESKSVSNERVVKPSPYTGSLTFSQVKAAVRAVMLSRGK
jgi:hypothetical protein